MKRRFVRPTALLPLLLLALLPRLAFAVGQQNGRIAGVVTEATSKAPLPGAEVTISSPALIGGPRTTQTGDDGSYEFVELPPGSYSVEAGYPGSAPARRRVTVRMGETAPLNIPWSAQLTDVKTYTVEEELHLTKPDSTQQGTVITTEQANRVATARSYQGVAQEVAGVVDTPGRGNPQVKGGNLAMNRYVVDGMDITDPVSNTFSANINFESLGAIEVLTGGMEAEYNALGGVISLETKAGGDKLHFDISGYVQNSLFAGSNANGSQVFDGLREFSTTPVTRSENYQANVVLGGPLVKQRLWFNLAFQYEYRKASIPVGPPLNLPHPPQTSHRYLTRLKLTYAPSDQHRLTLSASADPAFFHNLNQAGGQGLGITEQHQNQGGVFGILRWDYFITKNVNLTIPVGFQMETLDNGPEGILGTPDVTNIGMFSDLNRSYDRDRPQHVNSDDGTIWYQGGGYVIDRRYTAQFDPSLSLRGKWLGSHEAKIGWQSRFVRHDADRQTPGMGIVYTDKGGGPLEAGLCNPVTGTGGCYARDITDPSSSHQWGVGSGLFAQDRWKPTRWLTLLPGLRFDWGMTRNTLRQTVTSLFGLGPRFGATADLTGDAKTILSVFYGRATETLSLLPAANADAVGLNHHAEWNPATKMFDRNLSESGGADGFRIDRGATAPHTDEITAGLRREIFKDSVASVDYTYKRISNIWDKIEINQIWNPAGNRVTGYVNGEPRQIFLVTTPDKNYRTYQGVDLVFESRPSPHFDLYLAYTLSWLYGPGGEELGQLGGGRTGAGFSQFYNPRQAQFFDGFLANDIRHVLKLRASYDWHGLLLGAFMQYRTGAPLTRLYFENGPDAGYVLLRAPQGTDPGAGNSANAVAEFRLPDLVQVDLRAAYDFHELIGDHHLILMADFFNLFNTQTPTTIQRNDLPTFGIAQARQQPFSFQIGLKFTY